MNAADYIQEAFSAVAVAARRYNNPPGLTAMVHGTLRILAIVRLLFRRVFIARHGACTRPPSTGVVWPGLAEARTPDHKQADDF